MATAAEPQNFKSSLDDSTTQLNIPQETYKNSSQSRTTLRETPTHHFKQTLSGSHEPIPFLPNITIGFSPSSLQASHGRKNSSQTPQITIKTTSVRFPFTKGQNIHQLTTFFDISSRPIGATLNAPIEIRIHFTDSEFQQLKQANSKVVLNSFDFNTRSWKSEPVACDELTNQSYLSKNVKYFGKFCFTRVPIVKQFLLSDVATQHTISSTKEYTCQVVCKDDVLDKNGTILSVYNEQVAESDLQRAKNSLGIKCASASEIFNFKFNSPTRDESKTIQIKYISKTSSDAANDQMKCVALVQQNNGAWQVVDMANVFLCAGWAYRVAFVETDLGTAQDEKKLQYFGSELEFVQNSCGDVCIYVHQNLAEKNRLNIGFYPKTTTDGSADPSWRLVGKSENNVIEDLSKIHYKITGCDILTEDGSPKTLVFYKNNKTGIDFYVYRNNASSSADQAIDLELGIDDTVTKQIGVVLSSQISGEDLDLEALKPYSVPKNFEHVEVPEIYREYKLQWLKFLSPAEREKYKGINGL